MRGGRGRRRGRRINAGRREGRIRRRRGGFGWKVGRTKAALSFQEGILPGGRKITLAESMHVISFGGRINCIPGASSRGKRLRLTTKATLREVVWASTEGPRMEGLPCQTRHAVRGGLNDHGGKRVHLFISPTTHRVEVVGGSDKRPQKASGVCRKSEAQTRMRAIIRPAPHLLAVHYTRRILPGGSSKARVQKTRQRVLALACAAGGCGCSQAV